MTTEMIINLLLKASLTANALLWIFILYLVAKFKIIKQTIDELLKDNKKLISEKDQYREQYEYYYKQFSNYIDKHHESITNAVKKRKEDRVNDIDDKVVFPVSIKGQSYKSVSYDEHGSINSSNEVEQALRISLLTSPLSGYDPGNASDFVRSGIEHNGGFDSGSSCNSDSGSSSCSSFGD